MQWVSWILFISLSINTLAVEVAFIGGGGEPEGQDTVFDGGIYELIRAQNRTSMKITTTFNGGHAQTENFLAKLGGGDRPAKPISVQNFRLHIVELMTKLKAGNIKDNKLLITINTHGSMSDSSTKTHKISLSTSGALKDYNHFQEEEGNVYMDELKDLIALAKEKKVKLGIVDLSCFSGNSIKLSDSNTCVVSGSSDKHYAHSEFGVAFFKQIQAGKSLTDVYLGALSAIPPLASFPMISTPEGQRISDLFFKLLNPYLNYYSKKIRPDNSEDVSDLLTPYLSEMAGCGVCIEQRNTDFQKLISLIQSELRVNKKFASDYFGVDLVALLREYKATQDELLGLVKQQAQTKHYASQVELSFKAHSFVDGKLGISKMKLDIREALISELNSDDSLEARMKAALKYKADSTTNVGRYESQNRLNQIAAEKEILEKIKRENPNWRTEFENEKMAGQAYRAKLIALGNTLENKARTIGKVGNELFLARYQKERGLMKLNGDVEKNPCSDFVF